MLLISEKIAVANPFNLIYYFYYFPFVPFRCSMLMWSGVIFPCNQVSMHCKANDWLLYEMAEMS